jgi:hypothetical protein
LKARTVAESAAAGAGIVGGSTRRGLAEADGMGCMLVGFVSFYVAYLGPVSRMQKLLPQIPVALLRKPGWC